MSTTIDKLFEFNLMQMHYNGNIYFIGVGYSLKGFITLLLLVKTILCSLISRRSGVYGSAEYFDRIRFLIKVFHSLVFMILFR